MSAANKLIAAIVGLAALVGCEQGSGTKISEVPSAEEQACLRAVTAETNVADVILMGSSQSGSGTNVTVGVGPSQIQWACIAYADGTTSKPIKRQAYGIL